MFARVRGAEMCDKLAAVVLSSGNARKVYLTRLIFPYSASSCGGVYKLSSGSMDDTSQCSDDTLPQSLAFKML